MHPVRLRMGSEPTQTFLFVGAANQRWRPSDSANSCIEFRTGPRNDLWLVSAPTQAQINKFNSSIIEVECSDGRLIGGNGDSPQA